MWKEKNFWDKKTSNWFNKNPQNINRKWRPKKWVALINEELESKWYEPARKQDIEINYMHLVNLNEKELKALLADEKQPMIVRIIIKNMLSGKWFDIIEKMLDRAIWKPKQTTEEVWNKQNIEINIKNQELLDSLIIEED